MRMPRRITGLIAGAILGFTALTATGAHASDTATVSTSVVEQESKVLVTDAKPQRTKEERQPLRTKEE